MALIEPDSNIRILQDIPLDNTYHDTIYWETRDAQTDYFIGKTKYNLTDQSFQRVNRNTIRVGVKIGNLYNCDYIMFQNKSFSNKWFYAFITSVEYVNNVTSEITYELDVLQTWHFNYTVDHCFIEREHTSTDKIGDHIEPEPVSIGEYVYQEETDTTKGYTKLTKFCVNMCTIVAIVDVANDGTTSSDGQLYDGIYGGATLYAFLSEDVAGINNFLNGFTEKPDAIVGMYVVPLDILPVIPASGAVTKIPAGAEGASFLQRASAIDTSKTLDGYKPKNNKMYTYPYNFFCIDNSCGDTLCLRYEFFKDLTPQWRIYSCLTQPVQVVLRPRYYKNIGEQTLNTESISINNFPMCSWNMDAYQAWVAQNSIPLATKLETGIYSGLMGAGITMLSGNLMGAGATLGSTALQAYSNIQSALTQRYMASISADISKGNFNNGGANTSLKKNEFYGGRMSVNKCQAKIIDDFFTMFGYGVKVMGIPNRNVRPHFTYCKTAGCTLHGSIPSDDLTNISDIYNNGITWWKKPSEIGDYNLDNAPS